METIAKLKLAELNVWWVFWEETSGFERVESLKILISVGRENPAGVSATPSQEEERPLSWETSKKRHQNLRPEELFFLQLQVRNSCFSSFCLSVCTAFFVATSGRTPNYFYNNIGDIIPHELAFKMLPCFFMLWFYIAKNMYILKCAYFFLLNSVFTLEQYLKGR